MNFSIDPSNITTDQLITLDYSTNLKNTFTKLNAKGTRFSPLELAVHSLTVTDAVYFTGSDALLGPLIAIIYKDTPDSPSLSSILIGRHGVSESINMTIGPKSRFYGACLNLPDFLKSSTVRKALAISCLRTFSNMELALKSYLTFSSQENQLFDWDETTAGTLASSMEPASGKFPTDIGNAIINSGALRPKSIRSTVIDIIYENSHATNDLNNELVYLFGNQLEHLFDPLAEYSPEHTEMLYVPPSYQPMARSSDTETVLNVCRELFSIQSHFTTNLLGLLQDYLIPLRVKVLGGEIPEMNMRKLNIMFPPTIDEIVRVNNIFYEALALATPYGSYETMKACGISIPYFYKACMRHEAATRNFCANLRENLEKIQSFVALPNKFTVNSMESIIHCSLHLTKIKLVLDRLVKTTVWREDEKVNIEEFYQSAVGTIDSFGRESFISPYNNRIFTPTGKLLVEISKGWPKELEYGWINRRIITIFDAVDVIHGDQTNFSVVFVFTDSVVVIRPSEPLSITSESGIHKPSIADMLTHSMINSVPLPNLPELNVVGWAPIEDVYMAEFDGPTNLAMYVTGGGFNTGGNETEHLKLLKLIRPEVTANAIVNFIAKAKIMNKTQPFHLFLNSQPSFSTFATVYEHEGYKMEPRKSPIAVYANTEIPEGVLESHELIACIGTQIFDQHHVSITVISRLAYNHQEVVSKDEFSAALSTQISRLYSLYFDSSNPFSTEMIIKNNTKIANYLIDFATTSGQTAAKSHKAMPQKYQTLISATPPLPKSKRQPSIRQRISSASSMLSKISRRRSQDLLQKVDAEPKKRLSFSFLSNKDEPRSRPVDKAYRTMSTISLPIERVSEYQQDSQARYSHPARLPSPYISSPIKATQVNVTPKLPTRTPPLPSTPTPTYLAPTPLSTAQQQKVINRKTSFSAAHSPLLPQTSRYLTNMSGQDAMSIISSPAVKDSEKFYDFTSSSMNLIPNDQSTPVVETFSERYSGRFLETIESKSNSSASRDASSTTIEISTANHSSDINRSSRQVSYSADSFSGTHSSAFAQSHRSSYFISGSVDQSTLDYDDDNSSVENWYNALNAQKRAESLNSLDTDLDSGTASTNETTFDDEDADHLAMSLKNITSFIDNGPGGSEFRLEPFQFPGSTTKKSEAPQLPEIPSFHSTFDNNSILLTDDFAYLAGLVSGGGAEPQAISRVDSLYPGMRDSSLAFLSDYILTRDDSTSLDSITFDNDLEILDAAPPSFQGHLSVPSEDWRTISESSSMPSSKYSSARAESTVSYKQQQQQKQQQQLSPKRNTIRHVNSPSKENSTGLSANGTVIDLSVQEIISSSNDSPFFSNIGQQSAQHASSGSNRLSFDTSFAHLSSADIQLRSLTVTIDSLINEECAVLMSLPTDHLLTFDTAATATEAATIKRSKQHIKSLERLNQTVLRLHHSTQNLLPVPAHISLLEPKDQARVVTVERGNRQLLMSCLWPLIGTMEASNSNSISSAGGDHKKAQHQRQRLNEAFRGFLDLEWQRRTTMHEKLGNAMPKQIWSV